MAALRLELPAPVAGRIPALDELRGVAILLVIAYHAGGVLGWDNTLHGEVGVDMFVILSGAGLALAQAPGSAGAFLLRRFLRIYPAYWAALTVFLAGGAWVLHRHASAADVLLHYAGVHAWFGDAHALSINDSFWFITLIVTLYLAYLPLRRFVDRPDRLLLLGALVSIVPAVCCYRTRQYVGFDHVSLRFPGFFLGILLGRLLRTGRLEISATAALGAACLVLFYAPFTQNFVFASVWVGAALMAGYALLLRPHLGAGSRGALKFLGDRSLEIFLIHQPLIREYNILAQRALFPGAVPGGPSLAVGVLVALAAAVALASALHAALGRLPWAGRGRAAPGGPR